MITNINKHRGIARIFKETAMHNFPNLPPHIVNFSGFSHCKLHKNCLWNDNAAAAPATTATAAWLDQLGERRSAKQEVKGSNPGWTNTQGLYITEKKVLPL